MSHALSLSLSLSLSLFFTDSAPVKGSRNSVYSVTLVVFFGDEIFHFVTSYVHACVNLSESFDPLRTVRSLLNPIPSLLRPAVSMTHDRHRYSPRESHPDFHRVPVTSLTDTSAQLSLSLVSHSGQVTKLAHVPAVCVIDTCCGIRRCLHYFTARKRLRKSEPCPVALSYIHGSSPSYVISNRGFNPKGSFSIPIARVFDHLNCVSRAFLKTNLKTG